MVTVRSLTAPLPTRHRCPFCAGKNFWFVSIECLHRHSLARPDPQATLVDVCMRCDIAASALQRGYLCLSGAPVREVGGRHSTRAVPEYLIRPRDTAEQTAASAQKEARN